MAPDQLPQQRLPHRVPLPAASIQVPLVDGDLRKWLPDIRALFFLRTGWGLFQASSDHCRVKKDGFLNHQSLDNWMRGTEFNSIFKFRLCCSDVKVGRFETEPRYLSSNPFSLPFS